MAVIEDIGHLAAFFIDVFRYPLKLAISMQKPLFFIQIAAQYNQNVIQNSRFRIPIPPQSGGIYPPIKNADTWSPETRFFNALRVLHTL